MGKIYCIANQKGGVGKTTTTVNLAQALGSVNRLRVLLVDLDPQGNATMGSGVNKADLDLSVYQVLVDLCATRDAIVKPDQVAYHVLGSNRHLAGAEVELVEMEGREFRLKDMLDQVKDDYDVVLIDCPPSLSMLTINAFTAASGVIIPMQCEYFALEGLSDLVQTIQGINQQLNPDLSEMYLLRVMYDARMSLQQQVSEQLKEHFGDKVFDSIIPRNVRLAEAPSYGLPGVLYDRQARGSIAYMEFANELSQRIFD